MTIYALGDHRPAIHETAWVAPDANVIGQVTLGQGVSVWFGSTLRGDNEPIVLGQGTNAQENCVFHTDPGFPVTVGSNCTIGHKALIHGCSIGDETMVGMGATILNGARIGRNCLIGACALVTEGKEIPDGSLVLGTPGRVVRQLDEEAIEGLRSAAARYQERAAAYRDIMRVTG